MTTKRELKATLAQRDETLREFEREIYKLRDDLAEARDREVQLQYKLDVHLANATRDQEIIQRQRDALKIVHAQVMAALDDALTVDWDEGVTRVDPEWSEMMAEGSRMVKELGIYQIAERRVQARGESDTT